MAHAPSRNDVLPADAGSYLSVVDIRCLRFECASASDRRGDTCTEFVEPGRYSMAVAPCGNEFYGFRPVGAGYRGDVRDRSCATFRVYRCVYTQRHTRPGT